LDDCIKSILESKGVKELFLVDNASTDKSMDLIKKYTDERLKIIYLDKNVGLAKAGNIAATNVTSPYIAFADADSIVDSDWLQIPCYLLETHKEIGAVECNILCSKHPDRIPSESAKVLKNGCRWLNIPEKNPICYWQWLFPNGAAFVVRKEVWDFVEGFDSNFFVGNGDVDFGIRLWLSGYEVIMSSEGTVYHEGGKLRSRKEISPIFLYYEIKTTLSLWAKNLEGRTLIRYVLPFFILLPFMAFWRGGIAGLKGLISFLRSLPSILVTRKKVQQKRKTSDKKIIPFMRAFGILPLQQFIRDFRLFYKRFL
jgi:GT2 family glycosyltransferase